MTLRDSNGVIQQISLTIFLKRKETCSIINEPRSYGSCFVLIIMTFAAVTSPETSFLTESRKYTKKSYLIKAVRAHFNQFL